MRKKNALSKTIAAALGLAVLATGCQAQAQADEPAAGGGTSGSAESAVHDESSLHEIAVDLDTEAFDAMLDTYRSTGEKEWIKAAVTIDGETFEDAGMRLKGNLSLRGVTEDSAPASLPWLIRLDEFVEDQSLDGSTEFVVRANDTESALNEAVALDLLEEAGLASEHAVATAFSVNGSEEELRLVLQNLDETWREENFAGDGILYKAEAEGDWSWRGEDPEAYEDVFDQETDDPETGGENLTPLIELLDFINNSSDEEFAAELGDHLDVEAFATYLAFQDLIGNTDDIDGPGNNAFLHWDAESEKFTVVAWDHNLAFGVRPDGPGEDQGERPEGMPESPEGVTPPEGSEGPDGSREGEQDDRREDMTPPEGSDGSRDGEQDDRREGMTPHEGSEGPEGSREGERPEGMPEPPEGVTPPEGGAPGERPEGSRDGERPEGMPEPPEGMTPPQDSQGSDDGQRPEGMREGDGGPGGRSNVLVERFMEVEEFADLYDAAKQRLTEELVESGLAEEVLERRVEVLTEEAGDLVDEATVEEEAEAIREMLEGGAPERGGSAEESPSA